MRYSAFQTIRLISVMLIVASLMISMIVLTPVTLAENPSERDGKLSASNPLPVMENPSDDEALASVDPAMQARVQKAYGKLPLSFEPNHGQTDREVKFLSRGAGYTLFLTSTEAVLTLRNADDGARDDNNPQSAIRNPQSAVLRMKLAGANPEPQIVGEDQLPGQRNYLKGNDPKKWQQNVPLYAKVRYGEIYPGVDMLYYGNRQQLEYDFIVSPGADPQVIALDFEGADNLSLDAEGNLVLHTGAGEVVQHAPVIYQETDGIRQSIAGHYVIKDKSEVGFEVAAYDTSRPLMIDPVIQYSSFLGGSGSEEADGIAVDAAGNAYVTGDTRSTNFPTQNPISATPKGETDIFVTKFNADGSALIYSTLIGGNLFDFSPHIAVTRDGKACITGITGETDPGFTDNTFPITANAFQGPGVARRREQDAFVTVLKPDGSGLVYSTFYGSSSVVLGFGRDEGNGIAVDFTGNVYIVGNAASGDLKTRNGFQNNKKGLAGFDDAFIAKFNPLASSGNASLVYASFLGGSSIERGNAIALDKFNVAYVVGETFSDNFPTKSPSSLPPFQVDHQDGALVDGFIAKISPAQSGNSSLIYSTYLGGTSSDRPKAVAVDNLQRTYITGVLESDSGFPIDFPLKNAFDISAFGDEEAFVTKMNADGTSLFYSSFLGGFDNDEGNGIAVDAQGNAYVVGETDGGIGFPIENAFQPDGFNNEAFITKISAVSSPSVEPEILFSSFLGGSGNDGANAIALGTKKSIFVAGGTGSNNFPTTAGAFQKNKAGGGDAFVTKIVEVNPDTIGTFRPSDLTFRLRNSNTAGPPDITIGPNFYQAGDIPVTGDFNGDGIETTGVFRPLANSVFLLSDRIDGSVTTGVVFGQPGDIPLTGDWDADGKDGVGVFRPSAGQFLLRNKISPGPADITVTFGAAGDIPLAGDFDGDGDDTIGVFRNNTFFLRNKLNLGADIVVTFGQAGDVPLVGDWDGDGDDTIGVFRNATHRFVLRNVNNGQAAFNFDFGATGDVPLAGDWDGLSSNTGPNSGVNQPSEGSSDAGKAQQFVTTCSDPDGWRNIHTIDFKLTKPNPAGTGEIIAFWAQFDQNKKIVRLYDPDTQTWDEGYPGANKILSNRFVRLRLPGSMVEGSGPDGPSVQITWNVVFESAAVMDGYKQYLRIEDDAGFSTGYDEVGSWSITP